MTAVLALLALLWAIGLVDLLRGRSTARFARVLGRWSRRDAVLIVLDGVALVAILAAVAAAGAVEDVVGAWQRRGWPVAVVVAIALVGAWSLLTIDRNVPYRPNWLQRHTVWRFSTSAALLVVAGAIALVPFDGLDPVPSWMTVARAVVVVAAVAVVLVEVVVHVLVATGALPGRHRITGHFVPGAPVYVRTEEGHVRGHTNQRGWPAVPQRLRAGDRRIVLLGDDHLQGLPLPFTDQVGPRLERRLGGEAAGVEVLTLGMAGFGPGVYLSPTRVRALFEVYEPDVVVVVLSLGSDLETTAGPDGYRVHHVVEDGELSVHPESADPIHDLKHLVVPGYTPEATVADRVLAHVLTPKVLPGLLRPRSDGPAGGPLDVPSFEGVVTRTRRLDQTHVKILETDVVATPGRANALFAATPTPEAEHADAVIEGLLGQAAAWVDERGARFVVATVPAFPAAFFERPDDRAWSGRVGDLDLLRPERVIEACGERNGFEVVPLGRRLQEAATPVGAVAELYLLGGRGHLSERGHELLAEALAEHLGASAVPQDDPAGVSSPVDE